MEPTPTVNATDSLVCYPRCFFISHIYALRNAKKNIFNKSEVTAIICLIGTNH